jgi:hypothetical protein
LKPTLWSCDIFPPPPSFFYAYALKRGRQNKNYNLRIFKKCIFKSVVRVRVCVCMWVWTFLYSNRRLNFFIFQLLLCVCVYMYLYIVETNRVRNMFVFFLTEMDYRKNCEILKTKEISKSFPFLLLLLFLLFTNWI